MSDVDLLNVARLGIDAEVFAKSDVGQYMISKAQMEIDAEMSALVDADPEDHKLGREIRNKIHVARMFLSWLNEAIQVGEHACAQLNELDSQQ